MFYYLIIIQPFPTVDLLCPLILIFWDISQVECIIFSDHYCVQPTRLLNFQIFIYFFDNFKGLVSKLQSVIRLILLKIE